MQLKSPLLTPNWITYNRVVETYIGGTKRIVTMDRTNHIKEIRNKDELLNNLRKVRE